MNVVLTYVLMGLHLCLAAGTYVFSKPAAVEFNNPLFLTTVRSCGALVLLLFMAPLIIPKPMFSLREWCAIIGCGILLVPLNQYTFLIGLQQTAPSHPALLYALTPVFVMLITALREKKSPRLQDISAIMLALGGVVCMLRPWQNNTDVAVLRSGDLWLLAAVLCWALYTSYAKTLFHNRSSITITAWSLIAGALCMIAVGFHSYTGVDFSAISTKGWFGLLWLVTITSVSMMFLWNYLLKRLTALQVSVSTNAQPVATALLCALFYQLGFLTTQQDFSIYFFVAVVCVCGGVIMLQVARPARQNIG
ncbi:MAG: DMT family transporter [Chitinivibrionales bacterium]|nr:DMT family transporter [Chitinivibrionales bacterium]